MYLSDEQLMLLEQLTYLNSDVADAAGVANKNVENCRSVEDMLSRFDEQALKQLENAGDIDYTQGNEWAAIIRAIKNDKSLINLEISDSYSNKNEKTAAICFTDSNEPDKAIVAFRGTLDGDEWADNTEGLNVADTECQKEALGYIESLPYFDITVTGHSKGGNKAQYVTILSDKVTRCVSMDGQGFSREFMDKYWAEIQSKGSAIKNYSLNNDYVHILLFPVPGAEQLYIAGDGMVSWLENHSPNSYFHYAMDENGNAVIVYGDNGKIYLEKTNEAAAMVYLHEFICFVLNVMRDKDKDDVAEYLGVILNITMDPYEEIDGVKYKRTIEIDGVTYCIDNIQDYILSKPETLSLLSAYLIKYIEVYDLTEDQVYELLEAFGLGSVVFVFKTAISVNPAFASLLEKGKGLLRWILDNITDGKSDPLIEGLLSWCSSWLKENKGIDFDIASFWRETESQYSSIGKFDASTARQNMNVKTGKTMNFSKEAYELLLETISNFESNIFGDVLAWNNFACEEWYSALAISVARNGINKYINKLTDINSICRNRIDTVFANEWEIDKAASKKIQALFDGLDKSASGFANLSQRLSI